MDISSYYKANKSDFSTSTDARNKIADLYMQQTSTDIKVAGKGKTYFVFITDISISKTDQNGNPGKVAGIAGGIGRTWYCVLFNDRSSSTVVHELGHVLGFEHTFSKNLNQRQIPEKTTESYMDYSTTRNMFFLYQMKKIK